MLEDKRFKQTWIWVIITIVVLILVYLVWHFLFTNIQEVEEVIPD